MKPVFASLIVFASFRDRRESRVVVRRLLESLHPEIAGRRLAAWLTG